MEEAMVEMAVAEMASLEAEMEAEEAKAVDLVEEVAKEEEGRE